MEDLPRRGQGVRRAPHGTTPPLIHYPAGALPREGRLKPRRFWLASALSGLIFLVIAGALAAPPPDSDGRYANWFQSLRQPGTGSSCCSISDCRMTEYRAAPDGYEVLLAGRWILVPQDKIVRGVSNPTGRAVVCALNTQILCFVTPEET